ncbi:GNAT family N-acetyltransferase [Pontibacillus halophilus]|uniref:GNAT family N-acetyltransferase n=1 Tax=Pontibacillus halophilus TaxID=516704 RepID=UPI00047B6B1A|nr:GNAT family N-acetyltransferase [Pontibacillus halophilus]
MILKRINSDNYYLYKETIVELLLDIYNINFNMTKSKNENLSFEKSEQLYEFLLDKSAILIGIFKGEELQGFLWAYVHNYFGVNRIHVNQIAIKENHRGNGLAKVLMEEIEQLAFKEGIETIDLFVSDSNLAALNLYESMGFCTERRYMKKVL